MEANLLNPNVDTNQLGTKVTNVNFIIFKIKK